MLQTRLRQLIAVLGVTSLAWLLPISVVSASCSGGGGEEGAAAMDLTPNAYKWTGHFSREFVIENTGWSSWVISSWTHGAGYEVFDPNGCKGKSLPAFFGDECSIYVHGHPTVPPSTLTVKGTQGGVVVASDTSKLN